MPNRCKREGNSPSFPTHFQEATSINNFLCDLPEITTPLHIYIDGYIHIFADKTQTDLWYS